MIAFFSVHCSKKKGGGLGLGILALAGGGGSSSSSSSGDSTDKPKDDPKNDPEFDEVKKKIEQSIKFPTQNENKVLSNFNSVDLSITGDFLQDLGKLQKVKMEHSVSAGSQKTDPKEIDITQEFVTNKKIPLTLNLSSLQPDTGVAQPKLKLKFSADGKQIISKEWTQNFFLKGTNQKLIFTDEDNKTLDGTVVFRKTKTAKIKAENIPSSVQVRIVSNLKDVSGKDDAGDFTGIDTPSKEEISQKESTQTLTAPTGEGFKAYLIKAKAFIRLKKTENWQALSENVYGLYSFSTFTPYPEIKLDKMPIVKTGENIKLTFVEFPEPSTDIFLYDHDETSKIFQSVGNILVSKKPNGGPTTWNGRDYFTDITKIGVADIKDGDQFIFKGIKKQIVLAFSIDPSDPFDSNSKVRIKILVRP